MKIEDKLSNIGGSKLILSLDNKEFKSSFDAKEDERKDEISIFSDDDEESLWIESRKE